MSKTEINDVRQDTEKVVLSEHQVTLGEVQLHYRTAGRGPFLLLLHGFSLTGEQWFPFLDDLSQRYTLIIPDLPLHGKSNLLQGAIKTHEPFATAMLHLLDHLGISQVLGIGHSMGAISLMNMEIQRPGVIVSMVLVAGAPRFTGEVQTYLMKDSFELCDEEMKAFLLHTHPGGREQIDALFRLEHDWAESYPLTLEESNLSPKVLAGMKMPVYLIWGDRDSLFPVQTAVELYLSFPNVRLWVIPSQDHLPLWPELGGSEAAAELFVQEVKDFFTTPKAPG